MNFYPDMKGWEISRTYNFNDDQSKTYRSE